MCCLICVFYMTFYNLHSSVKLPPKCRKWHLRDFRDPRSFSRLLPWFSTPTPPHPSFITLAPPRHIKVRKWIYNDGSSVILIPLNLCLDLKKANHHTILITCDMHLSWVLRGCLHIPLAKTKWREKSKKLKAFCKRIV